VRLARLTLAGARTTTIAALVEAELNARGQRVDVVELPALTNRLGGERLVEVHLGHATGKPELVIDTDAETAADAAEKILAFLDGHALA
jgi:hypothetical protein